MNRILFVNGNLQGHFNPTLPVVQELVSRGEEVWYFASEKFKEQIEMSGAHFISTDTPIDEFNQSFRPTGKHPFYTLLEYKIKYDKAMIPVLLERIKGMTFDILVFDSYLGAGSFLPKILSIPSVCSMTTFAIPKLPLPEEQLVRGYDFQLDEFYKVLDEQCDLWQVPTPDILSFFSVRGDSTLVYTSREFNPGGMSFDNSYYFVGPSLTQRKPDTQFPWEKLNNNKLIYISMGTINTALQDFYKMCLLAFGDTKYQFVMSVGDKVDFSSLGEVPDNFILCHQAPQLEILEHASLFITHGGFNSISEAIYYGVPSIVLPLVNDQYINAAQIDKMELGIKLSLKDLSASILKSSADKILNNSYFTDNVQKLRTSFQNGGGYQKAADVIMQLGDRKWQ